MSPDAIDVFVEIAEREPTALFVFVADGTAGRWCPAMTLRDLESDASEGSGRRWRTGFLQAHSTGRPPEFEGTLRFHLPAAPCWAVLQGDLQSAWVECHRSFVGRFNVPDTPGAFAFLMVTKSKMIPLQWSHERLRGSGSGSHAPRNRSRSARLDSTPVLRFLRLDTTLARDSRGPSSGFEPFSCSTHCTRCRIGVMAS